MTHRGRAPEGEPLSGVGVRAQGPGGVGLVVVREMARHRLRRVPYIGVPRHIVEERMQPFHLRAIERGGGAAVSAADFYAFQQRQGAWGRDAA